MSSQYLYNLTESGITMFEQYIATKNVTAPDSSVKESFYSAIKPNYYEILNTSPVTTCYHVGENCMYWAWYIYKSKSSKIYLIQVYLGDTIADMYYIDNASFTKLFWQIKKN